MRQNRRINAENKLQVLYKNRLVGTLVMTPDHKAAFAYEKEWLENGFSISPFSLPLTSQIFVPTKDCFGGLFGVFADSLPDAWGRLLLHRMLKKRDISEDTIHVLDRLAIVGDAGMGALTYQPQMDIGAEPMLKNLDELAAECQKLLHTEDSEKLDELYRMGGTSGGARPKILTHIDGEAWMIKFPAHVDRADVGKMEYDYAQCASACGISMSQTRLFASKECSGYFGTKRFDRIKEGAHELRVHMLTAAALLELDFEQPSLDYHSLMKLTKILTRDCAADIENLYRRMCFNVFAHNRDDHSKNFTYLYKEESDEWRLAPAYDLTYSDTYYGEHTTSVDGNGRNPGMNELFAVGTEAGMQPAVCKAIAEEIQTCVKAQLGQYL